MGYANPPLHHPIWPVLSDLVSCQAMLLSCPTHPSLHTCKYGSFELDSRSMMLQAKELFSGAREHACSGLFLQAALGLERCNHSTKFL